METKIHTNKVFVQTLNLIFQIHTYDVHMCSVQGDYREEARRAHKIPISAQNGPFGQPGR